MTTKVCTIRNLLLYVTCLTLTFLALTTSAATPQKSKNFSHAGQELGVSTYAMGKKQLQATGPLLPESTDTTASGQVLTVAPSKKNPVTARYEYTAGALTRITLRAPTIVAKRLFAGAIKQAQLVKAPAGVYARGNGQVVLIQHSGERTAEVVFSTSAAALDASRVTPPAGLNWIWVTLGIAAMLIVAWRVPVKRTPAKAAAAAVPVRPQVLRLQALEKSLDEVAQFAPAMQDWLQYRSDAARPGAQRWTAAVEEARIALAAAVSGAYWHNCLAASEFIKKFPKAWTEVDLVLVPMRRASQYRYGAASIILPISLLIYTWQQHASAWWWLLAGLAAILLWLFLLEGSLRARNASQSAHQRANVLRHRVQCLQWSLGLSQLTHVTPALVQALAARYQTEWHLRDAAAKVRKTAVIYKLYRAGNPQYDQDQRTGWAADDSDFGSNYRSYSPRSYSGGGGGYSSGGGGGDWSGNDDSVNSRPFGYFNPASGLPMLENSMTDMGGHMYGTNDF